MVINSRRRTYPLEAASWLLLLPGCGHAPGAVIHLLPLPARHTKLTEANHVMLVHPMCAADRDTAVAFDIL